MYRFQLSFDNGPSANPSDMAGLGFRSYIIKPLGAMHMMLCCGYLSLAPVFYKHIIAFIVMNMGNVCLDYFSLWSPKWVTRMKNVLNANVRLILYEKLQLSSTVWIVAIHNSTRNNPTDLRLFSKKIMKLQHCFPVFQSDCKNEHKLIM